MPRVSPLRVKTAIPSRAETSVDGLVRRLYQQRNHTPLWLTPQGPDSRAEMLLNVLIDARHEGLFPADYQVDTILGLWHRPGIREQSRLDYLLTRGLTLYLLQSRRGRISSCGEGRGSRQLAHSFQAKEDFALLSQAVEEKALRSFLLSQQPNHPQYPLLRQALQRYRRLALAGDWPTLAHGPLIRPGMYDQRLVQVHRRLRLDQAPLLSPLPHNRYTPALESAIKRFQQRFNLEADGIIGQATIKALNIPARQLIRQILLNMERLRWLPQRLKGPRVVVNIAGFRLTALDGTRVALEMPVIVGTTVNKTPTFNDSLRYLVFNPYWNIPDSIAANEILPSQLKDPNYLEENNIRVFADWDHQATPIPPEAIDWQQLGSKIRAYRFRQEPGPDNALGQLKFIFPNRHHIYLHDTPATKLFSLHRRSFSHGCIRVAAPRQLALFLLEQRGPGWDLDRIDQLIQDGQRTVISLGTPIPIHITYSTVVVDPENDETFFYQDIYGLDQQLANHLFAPAERRLCRSQDAPATLSASLPGL